MNDKLPVWDNSAYYASIDDPAIETQLAEVTQLTIELAQDAQQAASSIGHADTASRDDLLALPDLYHRQESLNIKLGDLGTFVGLTLAVDAANETARDLEGRIQQVDAQIEQAFAPVENLVLRLPVDLFEQLLELAGMADRRFRLTHDRLWTPFLLSTEEEQLLSRMAVDGLHGWSNHYFQLAGSLKCEVTVDGEVEQMGLAQASNLLSANRRATRASALAGINQVWTDHDSTVASILNAINGWRLSEFDRRSYQQPLHYLEVSCQTSHIARATLDALIEACYQRRTVGQRGLRARMTLNGIADPKPHDLFAPNQRSQSDRQIPFAEAVQIIASAFSRFDPEMGEFAIESCNGGGVDAAPSPNRATGAFCATYNSTREPRVFMTYDGTMDNVMTLAHELGHAWHSRVLSTLPYSQSRYPMTLAETASTFAETLVRDALMQQAGTDEELIDILWQEAESAGAMLVDIPSRFDLEKSMVEARKAGALSAARLKSLTTAAWERWYEDALTEYNDMFWASKLHFSISQIGFYNYPYVFGYLFSLGIYAQMEALGDQFAGKYRAILRDTGSMSAERLIEKHLGQNISQPEFWLQSVDIVEQRVAQLENLVSAEVEKSR